MIMNHFIFAVYFCLFASVTAEGEKSQGLTGIWGRTLSAPVPPPRVNLGVQSTTYLDLHQTCPGFFEAFAWYLWVYNIFMSISSFIHPHLFLGSSQCKFWPAGTEPLRSGSPGIFSARGKMISLHKWVCHLCKPPSEIIFSHQSSVTQLSFICGGIMRQAK